jgi:hypothetical protein
MLNEGTGASMKEKPGEYIAIYWDDDSDVEYVRGHVTLAEARAALEHGCGQGCGDFAHSIKHRWARWQPAPRSSDFDSLFVTRDDQARGCFTVTEVTLGKKMAPDVLGA